MYSWSLNLSQISLKKSFGKVVFQIFAKIEMTRKENRLFGRHFETVQIFYTFSLFSEIWLWLVCTYILYIYIYIYIWCKNNFKIPGMKVVFFSLCTNGRSGYLIQVSFNKAVLEPQVSPAFAITYFCNHCNISPTLMAIHQSMWIQWLFYKN